MLERLLCSNVVHELWRYYRLVKKMRDSSFIEKYRWGKNHLLESWLVTRKIIIC